MDDNGLPPLPQEPGSRDQNSEVKDQSSGTVVPEPVVVTPVDNAILPPLPVPGDTVTPVVSDTVSTVTPSPTEPEKPKKKSNMKVVAGLMVALFLVGAAITASVMFPAFRGDLRQRAAETSEGGGNENTGECDTTRSCPDGSVVSVCNSCPDYQVTAQPTQEIPYEEVHYTPAPTSTEDGNYSGGGSGDNGSSGGTGGGDGGGNECEVVRQCPDGSTRSVCESCPPIATSTTTVTNECSGASTQCVGGYTQRCSNGEWYDTQQRCCTQDPVLCWDGTEVNGCWGECPTIPTVSSCPTECCGSQTQCISGYTQRCSGGQWYDTQQSCSGTGGQTGSCTQLGTTCVCNTCHRDGFNSATGYMCNSTGTEFDVTRKCDMPDSGTCGTNTNCEIQTCGCLNTGEASAGETGPYHCWVKNGTTGAWIREIGETIPNKLGCKGSGAPSVTTSVTASVTTGGGSSSGGSSSSSSGGSSSSSSSSSGGVTAMCVETRVYLKKADGTFDTVATPIAQLSSKISVGNVIRLAIRGNLANFTKGRFIIKKDGTVLETKETTTKNNLPGDPATFEYIYDYTVASGGSYSIEGAVWQ